MKFAKLVLAVLPVVAVSTSDNYTFEYHASLYNLDVNDDALRKVFEANMKVIAKSDNYFPNKFTHWTPEQFKRMVNGYIPSHHRSRQQPSINNNRLRGLQSAPASVDWVEEGAVTTVKDQGSCGSCYIFAATAVLEAAYFFANNTLVTFSEEQSLECAPLIPQVENACGGGEPGDIFAYANSTGGLETYADLPYTYQNYTEGEPIAACPSSSLSSIVPFTVGEVVQVTPNNTQALMQAVSQTPVTVSISGADCPGFQHNFGNGTGIFTQAQCSCDPTTEAKLHAVTIVGYGTQDGIDYWKIKNSWGTQWGNEGFFLLARDSNQISGECNVLANPVYASLTVPQQ